MDLSGLDPWTDRVPSNDRVDSCRTSSTDVLSRTMSHSDKYDSLFASPQVVFSFESGF